MVELSVGIVSEPPDDDDFDNPIRDWAIGQLLKHGNLDESAADQLRRSPLPTSTIRIDIERSLFELTLRDSECRNLHLAADLYSETIALKQQSRARDEAEGVLPNVTLTDIAQDQASLALTKGQLNALDCPLTSTTEFIDQLLLDPESPYFLGVENAPLDVDDMKLHNRIE